jgi:prophage regulatory protein
MGSRQQRPIRPAAQRILRLPAVLEVTGLSESTLRRQEQDGGFPQARRLGPRSIGWLEGDVQRWLVNRPVRGDTTRA